MRSGRSCDPGERVGGRGDLARAPGPPSSRASSRCRPPPPSGCDARSDAPPPSARAARSRNAVGQGLVLRLFLSMESDPLMVRLSGKHGGRSIADRRSDLREPEPDRRAQDRAENRARRIPVALGRAVSASVRPFPPPEAGMDSVQRPFFNGPRLRWMPIAPANVPSKPRTDVAAAIRSPRRMSSLYEELVRRDAIIAHSRSPLGRRLEARGRKTRLRADLRVEARNRVTAAQSAAEGVACRISNPVVARFSGGRSRAPSARRCNRGTGCCAPAGRRAATRPGSAPRPPPPSPRRTARRPGSPNGGAQPFAASSRSSAARR